MAKKPPKKPAKKKTEKTEKDLQAEIDASVKMFDVAKPGKTPPSTTSRPIIVSHGSMLKDPMVREEEEEPPEPDKIKTKTGELKLQPLSEKDSEVKEAPANEPGEPDTPKSLKAETSLKVNETPETAPKEEEEIAKVDSEPEKTEEAPTEPESESGPAPKEEVPELEVKNPNEEADKRLAKEEKEAADFENKLKEAEKIAESKEFFVSIGKVTRRRSTYRLLFTLLFVVVASVIFLNFAVDAELVEIGVEPFTNLL